MFGAHKHKTRTAEVPWQKWLMLLSGVSFRVSSFHWWQTDHLLVLFTWNRVDQVGFWIVVGRTLLSAPTKKQVYEFVSNNDCWFRKDWSSRCRSKIRQNQVCALSREWYWHLSDERQKSALCAISAGRMTDTFISVVRLSLGRRPAFCSGPLTPRTVNCKMNVKLTNLCNFSQTPPADWVMSCATPLFFANSCFCRCQTWKKLRWEIWREIHPHLIRLGPSGSARWIINQSARCSERRPAAQIAKFRDTLGNALHIRAALDTIIWKNLLSVLQFYVRCFIQWLFRVPRGNSSIIAWLNVWAVTNHWSLLL